LPRLRLEAAERESGRRAIALGVALAGYWLRGVSGSSGGCGPMTLVSARQAQISSLHAGRLGAEPPTPMAPMNCSPSMKMGRPPELAKLPNEY
jgi:hypothetical protein